VAEENVDVSPTVQRRYDGDTEHADWCRADDDHDGKCLDRLLEKVRDQ
jgi:hypothetical protein